MKPKQRNNIFLTVFILLLSFSGFGQAFLTGGYQGGILGQGGDDAYNDVPPPRNLSALGGNSEVILEWESPAPQGEVRYDDNSAELWYWLNNPSSGNDLFYVKFNAPVNGDVTHIAILTSAVSPVSWNKVMVCPDDGSGKPDLINPWQSFTSVNVTTSPLSGGEWAVLALTFPQTVSYNDIFYVVTQWPSGSTTGPFIGTDNNSSSGRSAYSVNNGTTWVLWTENFIMRAYMTDNFSKSVMPPSIPVNKNGFLPVLTLNSGLSPAFNVTNLALSIKLPEIQGLYPSAGKSASSYNVYRSANTGGPYNFLDNVAGLSYTDVSAVNSTLNYYVVRAVYTEGESVNSNEASAYPQVAINAPYSNNFDSDNGEFYATGDWQWGSPSYAGGPASAYSAPNVWGTVLNGNYSDNSYSWLIQPFDLSMPVTYILNFAYWHISQSGFDFGYVVIDHDYDGIYQVIKTYTGNLGGWHLENITIPDSLCTDYARLAFVLSSNTNTTFAGLYIDNLNIDRYFDTDLTVFLEGPFNGASMNTHLNSESLIPLSQPFNTPPWNYSGTESVAAIPNGNVVDWVLVQSRDAADAGSATGVTAFSQQAAFLLSNGSITGLDGTSLIRFSAGIQQQLFVVIYHRNHVAVMSGVPMNESAGLHTFDYSTGAGQVYGGAPAHKELTPGVWGMMSGDADGNGLIENADKNDIWEVQSGTTGYKESDLNMNGQINNPDKDDKWLPNLGAGSLVPE